MPRICSRSIARTAWLFPPFPPSRGPSDAVRVQKLEGSLEASRSEMARLAAEASFVKAKADEYATELKKWMKACCPR